MYDLPTSLEVGGVEYRIRSDFRAVIDILIAMNDPELDEQGKAAVILKILYPAWREIPPEHHQEALQKAAEFIDCGQKSDGKKHPRMIDWEQDAPLIIPAVNSVAHTEVRAIPDLHWWTFFGWFMEIGDSVFSNVLRIRDKKAKGKKLEKAEQEWYGKNRHLVNLKPRYSEDDIEFFKRLGWL
ncbi:MAG: Gp15 family bacteriophage protein [Faecousia sp.]